MNQAKLHIVGTPLGSRLDITLRALETLKSLRCFFVEDSREFRKLLDLHGISYAGKEIHSYAAHNMKEATARALEALTQGTDIGLTSDRGTPGISDPGAMLVREAFKLGFALVPIPGVSSLTTLVSVCPLQNDDFLFVGFLPLKVSERQALWGKVRALGTGVVFFESPQRVRQTAKELAREFPRGSLFYGREMTKMHEEFRMLPLAEGDFESLQDRGEYSFFLHPGETQAQPSEAWREEVRLRCLSEKAWAKEIASRYDLSSSEVYNALQQIKKNPI